MVDRYRENGLVRFELAGWETRKMIEQQRIYNPSEEVFNCKLMRVTCHNDGEVEAFTQRVLSCGLTITPIRKG